MNRRLIIAASFILLAAGGTVGAYAIYERRADAQAVQRVREVARLRGASAATADIRAGHIVLRHVCATPVSVESWRREYGVECRLNIFQACGGLISQPSEALRLREAAYDEVMVRHVRARFGPRVFQNMQERLNAVSATTATPGGA
jgi:hypothetical protein